MGVVEPVVHLSYFGKVGLKLVPIKELGGGGGEVRFLLLFLFVFGGFSQFFGEGRVMFCCFLLGFFIKIFILKCVQCIIKFINQLIKQKT